jgi:hypothetical protein
MLHTVRIRFPTLQSYSQVPLSKYEMTIFSTLSSKALKVVIDNKYAGDGNDLTAGAAMRTSTTAVYSAVMRTCRMIEQMITMSDEQRIPNCAMDDFPWLKELPPFATHLSRDCRVRIATGFQTGLFTASDKALQAALVQALIIAGPLEPIHRMDYVAPKPILKKSFPWQSWPPQRKTRSRSRSLTPPSDIVIPDPPSPLVKDEISNLGAPSPGFRPQRVDYDTPQQPMVTDVAEARRRRDVLETEMEPSESSLESVERIPVHLRDRHQPDGSSPITFQADPIAHPPSTTIKWQDQLQPPVKLSAPYIRALFNFNGRDASELTFMAGDMIEVLDYSSNLWWKGAVRGQVGLFPITYVVCGSTV